MKILVVSSDSAKCVMMFLTHIQQICIVESNDANFLVRFVDDGRMSWTHVEISLMNLDAYN